MVTTLAQIYAGSTGVVSPLSDMREGRRVTPPPLAQPRPGGGDGCRAGARRWGRATDAPAPLVRSTGGGDGCRRYAPFSSRSSGPLRDKTSFFSSFHAA